MIPEIGLFSLILAFVFAFLLATVPAIGLVSHKMDLQNSAKYYVLGQFSFIAIAFICLGVSFLTNDFSVVYVLTNSSVNLPWFYKICAIWGGHEGSMLLWVAILTCWMLAVYFGGTSLDGQIKTRIMVVLGVLSSGFLLFLLMTSNPFLRQFKILETQGRDLNPLLQDPGFLFHPPMLYMGYVGFAVAFAFAIAALWVGKVESSWARWTRPWTLGAWCCLTAGITLGSWWAYRELGWGGWWFWDPVENASFMPWLAGTALIHSLAVSEKQQQFKAWTLLLAIVAFSLSLIGTFLVRSGVLTSVHAFAVDPQRGLYILFFLVFVIGGSLLLFALRAQTLKTRLPAALLSRESALLLNNVFLTVAMVSVLMGTVYPLLIDGLGLGKLSVGSPYFNTVFIPLIMPLIFLMGFGIHLRWGKDNFKEVIKKLRWTLFLSLILPLLLYFSSYGLNIMVLLSLGLAFWVSLGTFFMIYNAVSKTGLNKLNRAFWGMVGAHLGVIMTLLGITISTEFGVQDDVKMSPGSKINLAGYTIQFIRESSLRGPNYHGAKAEFLIKNGERTKQIFPEKRVYDVGGMAMTDSAIDVTPFRDIYVALGEPLDEDAWSVRLYYKPLVRWIWAGGFMILFGGLLALSDPRYYRKPTRLRTSSFESNS